MTISKEKWPNGVIMKISFIISALAFLIMIAIRLKLTFSISTDLAGVEQNVIYSIQTFLDTGKLYTDPGHLPFSITQYTPIYHYVCAFTAKAFHVDPLSDIQQLYLIGRTWNIVFNVLSAVSVYLIARRFGLHWRLAAILGFLAFISVFRQGFSVRPDSLYDCFSLWSVYLLIVFLDERKPARSKLEYLFISLVLSVCAIFTKQSGIQLPVIFLTFFLFVREWKAFASASAIYLMVFSAFLLFFVMLYKDAFLKNVIGGLDNGISIHWFQSRVWGNGFKIKVILPAAAALYIVVAKLLVFKGDTIERFLCFCISGMFVFSAITILKDGSNIQYFYVPVCLTFVLIAHYTNSHIKHWRLYRLALPGLSFLLMMLLAVNVRHHFQWLRDIEYVKKARIGEKERAARAVAEYFYKDLGIGANDYIFADLAIESADLKINGRRGINNLLFRNCVVPQLEMFDAIKKAKVLGFENFDKCLKEGQIKYIISSNPPNSFQLTENLILLRDRNYLLLKRIGGYSIYKYRGS